MLLTYLHRTVWLIGLVLLQALVLNDIHIGGWATPMLYVYLVLKLPTDTPRNAAMLWAMATGLAVDAFADTMGMNAAAAVLLAYARPTLLRLFVTRDTAESIVPSARTMGQTAFLKYVLASVLAHHTVLFALQYPALAHWDTLLARIACSTLLTTACVLAVEGIRKKQ